MLRALRSPFCFKPSSRAVLLAGALSLGVATFGAAEASATVVVLHSLDKMTANADVIVHARVHESRFVREQGRTVTLTDIEVIDGFKGAKAGDVLTIYQVGGVWDGERTQVIGAYEWTAGEEMVLFAVNHTGGRIVTYGVGVGKYDVQRNDDGVLVVPAFGDVAVMRQQPGGATTMGKPPVVEARPLATLKAEVLESMARPQVRGVRGAKIRPSVEKLRRTPLKGARKPANVEQQGQ